MNHTRYVFLLSVFSFVTSAFSQPSIVNQIAVDGITELKGLVPTIEEGKTYTEQELAEEISAAGIGLEEVNQQVFLNILRKAAELFPAKDHSISFTHFLANLGRPKEWKLQLFRTLANIGCGGDCVVPSPPIEYLDKQLQKVIDESNVPLFQKTIGTTTRGKDIHAYTTFKEFANKPVVWIDGLIHANEPLSFYAVLDLMQELTNMDQTHLSSRELAKILFSFDFVFIPIINRDGYKISTERVAWRKNTYSPKDAPNIVGIDLNRNFPHALDHGNVPETDWNNPGPFPGSEPEVQALMNLAYAVFPIASLHFHSNAHLLLTPELQDLNDRDKFNSLLIAMSHDLKDEYGNHSYVFGSPTELGLAKKPIQGTMGQWMYDSFESFSLTFELLDPNNSSPWPNEHTRENGLSGIRGAVKNFLLHLKSIQ